MTGRALKSPRILGLKWSILGGSSPCTALVPRSSSMNCDTMTGGAAPSPAPATSGRAARGRATTVRRDPTAIPHGRSTATPAPLASWSLGAETVAGQEAEAAADGDGEGAEDGGAGAERRRARCGAAAAKAAAAVASMDDDMAAEAEELVARRWTRTEETASGALVRGRSGEGAEEARRSSRRVAAWARRGDAVETEKEGSSKRRRKRRYAAAAASSARRHARLGGMARWFANYGGGAGESRRGESVKFK
jgi:hypothetical protein